MCQETCRLSNSTKHIPAHIHSICIHTYKYIYTYTYVCIFMYSSLGDQKSEMEKMKKKIFFFGGCQLLEVMEKKSEK